LFSVVIKIFFAVLVLCTLAVVAVILAVHFRVKRHLQEQTAAAPEPGFESGLNGAGSTTSSTTEDISVLVVGVNGARQAEPTSSNPPA